VVGSEQPGFNDGAHFPESCQARHAPDPDGRRYSAAMSADVGKARGASLTMLRSSRHVQLERVNIGVFADHGGDGRIIGRQAGN